MAKIAQTQSRKLIDGHGREVNYLRISLTDRCNLKCIYCHPPQKIDYLDRAEICSYGELYQVVKTAVRLGIDKVRLTGGEPLLRRGILEFLRSLHELEHLREVCLTTNGTLLLPILNELKEIGVKRINVSLDTLSEDLFYHMTGSRKLDAVMDAIQEASQLFKVKVNMVVLRGVNHSEIVRFMDTFLDKSVEVRFIEFMPLCGKGWKKDSFFPYEKIKEAILSEYDLSPLPSTGAAREFVVLSGGGQAVGKVGIIAPVTRPFCGTCSRLRLSARGELRPCLFSEEKIDLLPILREGSHPRQIEHEIESAFRKSVGLKSASGQPCSGSGEVYIRSIGG